ncbi:hypothetical protein [Ruegeria meonggei]|uniref:hypothetical protein n=1 Tax=Ruegeria meonggei TaxID=1446476 RepID=UPI0036711437
MFDDLGLPTGDLLKTSVAKRDLVEVGGVVSKAQHAQASGEAAGNRIELEIQFSSKGNLYLYAADTKTTTLTNLRKLGAHLSDHQDWKRSFRFVYQIEKAKEFTVLVGNQKTARVVASLDASTFPITNNIAEILAGGHWESSSDFPVNFVGSSGNFAMKLGYVKAPLIPYSKGGIRTAKFFEGNKSGERIEVEEVDPCEVFA